MNLFQVYQEVLKINHIYWIGFQLQILKTTTYYLTRVSKQLGKHYIKLEEIKENEEKEEKTKVLLSWQKYFEQQYKVYSIEKGSMPVKASITTKWKKIKHMTLPMTIKFQHEAHKWKVIIMFYVS